MIKRLLGRLLYWLFGIHDNVDEHAEKPNPL
jgi:hypothetical protein